jgi:brefeldin A-inhibited guanine nucleotide-exchange protein
LGIGEGSSPRESTDTRGGDPNETLMSPSNSMPLDNINISTPIVGTPDPSGVNTPTTSTFPGEDDPLRFENAKQRKTSLIEGIRKFNFKPKRGIAFLIENGFIRRPPPIPSEDPSQPPTIPSPEPREVARFLLHYGSAADGGGLNKAQIGEFLGEGEPENIAIMHAFVDLMNFENMAFVDALRRFLQAFRLPGEAQKIDRFMLKFAERFVKGNPKLFANAGEWDHEE